MTDMLVNLLRLPPLGPALDHANQSGVIIRRAQPFELTPVRAFVEQHFSSGWADEVSVGFTNKPVTVLVATFEKHLIGFGAYECTRKAFFGPMGIVAAMRSKGIGKALLLSCLQGLQDMGYVYGIVGGVGPVEFYEEAVGAVIISGSEPGIYTDLLRSPKQ
jgi:GNAT superfamily N-acetyltransferase